MRGEDPAIQSISLSPDGSPPHARGRPVFRDPADVRERITPACAGKTVTPDGDRRRTQDHPRMRGEDRPLRGRIGTRAGSPPHARGRHHEACLISSPTPDHPRMRGEDAVRQRLSACRHGSPPHARGRQELSWPLKMWKRITPACAGKTICRSQRQPLLRDHPRMRGEDSVR